MTNLADIFPVNLPSYPAVVSATVPLGPMLGTIWFDTTANSIKVYNGTAWVIAAGGSVTTPAAQFLSDLLDVDVSSVMDGDILVYDAASSMWYTAAQDNDFGRY